MKPQEKEVSAYGAVVCNPGGAAAGWQLLFMSVKSGSALGRRSLTVDRLGWIR